MNRRIIRLSLLLALSMALTLPGLVSPVSAHPQTSVINTNTEVPIEFFNVDSCTGDTVTINGTSHVVFHNNGTPSGNSNTKTEINFALQGVGAPSGNQYVVNETVTGTTETTSNGTFVFNSVSHLNVISQGSADNLKVRTEIHATFNSNGELTSSRFDFTVECQG
jgi:hypothetical protein